MPFSIPITIRFQHCDSTGLVFYHRYFEMFNLVVEVWFDRVIGVGFNRLHSKERIGVPMARIKTDFRAMSRLEDNVVLSLVVNRIGKSSMNLTVRAVCVDELRCNANLTLVCFDLDTRKASAWPSYLRNKFETYCKENQ